MPPGYHPLDVEKEWGKLHVAILEREKQLRSEFERWAGTAVGEAAGGWGPAVAGKPPRVSHCLGRKSPPPRLGNPHSGPAQLWPRAGREAGRRRELQSVPGSLAARPHSRRVPWALWAADWSVFSGL